MVPAGSKSISPIHCQSPAVRETEVTSADVFVVMDTDDAELEIYSPTLPACALSPNVVPTIPDVVEGVMVLVACRVVNFPDDGVVPPIAGGDARYVENPVPLTVLEALSVVNAPLEAVVFPIGPGDENVVPPRVDALIDVLQLNPTPDVHRRASVDRLQDGTDCPDGVVAVKEPKS